ncbi:MAG: peptidylprolyl isomerase [Sulfurimonas sp.]|nr:MAG: peptidylprolyl isomerase [Sulfurimonas sp.]
MITWMQRHKKYLIITIWISTIAFVGAGFVGWGQYSYGDKAGAIAKVGNIEITMGDLQKSYSNLYSQYSQMFQGDFDEEKAKSFGLKSQALRHLTQQALILNLASAYDLEISDAELLAEIKTQKYFFEDNIFNKKLYKSVLLKNNLAIKEYEAGVKKELLIKKTLALLPINTNENEFKIFDTILNIADKINYKIINDKNINIDTSDELVKSYWEEKKQNFKTPISYDIRYIKQNAIKKNFDDAKVLEYYTDNRTHFKDNDGKILEFTDAKERVISELNSKETKKAALRAYIAYKKAKLSSDIKIHSVTISSLNNPFTNEVLEKILTLTPASPFLKPLLINNEYYTFELLKSNPSTIKSFQDAKAEILPMYINNEKKLKLLNLAIKSLPTFTGTTTDFLTRDDSLKLTNLEKIQANEFLSILFNKKEKRGFITLEDGSIVLYNILEQKLLDKTNTDVKKQVVRLKSAMFNEGLIKNLQNKYKTEIFIQGL